MKYKLIYEYAISSLQNNKIIQHWTRCGGTIDVTNGSAYTALHFVSNNKNTITEFYLTFNEPNINAKFIEIQNEKI